MTRALALLVAALAFLAGSGPSRAQGVDMRDIMGGGPNFFGRGGASKRSGLSRPQLNCKPSNDADRNDFQSLGNQQIQHPRRLSLRPGPS